MAKVLEKVVLSTKGAREDLPLGDHWESVDLNVHLGYRRATVGGSWLVRWRHEAGYRRHMLGVADDIMAPVTGTTLMNYESARKAARDHVTGLRKAKATEITAAAEIVAAGPLATVEHAVSHYIETRDARASKRAGRRVRSDAGQRLRRHVLGQPRRGKQDVIDPSPIASIALHQLGDADIAAWRDALPAEMKTSSRQRLINDFRAALNVAYSKDRAKLTALPGVLKHGFRAIEIEDQESPARESQVLSDGDLSRILISARTVDETQGWQGDLFRLVVVLAATGCRMSQACRMCVRDVQFSGEGRLIVPTSRKGKGKKIANIIIPVGRDVLDELLTICTGRLPGAILLERWRKEQVPGDITWRRGERGPWRSASELSRPWQDIRKVAGLPDAIPYSLRHSSIVRSITANLPLRLVAAQHDTSTQMIERHYSRWISSGLEAMVRAAVVPLVPSQDSANVVAIRPRA